MDKTNIIKLVVQKAVDGKLNVEEATEIIKGITDNGNDVPTSYPTYPCVTPITPIWNNPYDPYKVTCSYTNNLK